MDRLFSGLGSGIRVSMKDSIMMDILHSAMNKAHEKMKCKEGVLDRLIEISKFYEFAVMELEGCLRIVQEETQSFALETKHEEVLSDLFTIKERLQGRLEETELTIMNKDRELIEKTENEFLLKEALDLKERELASLHENHVLRKTKSDGMAIEFEPNIRENGDEDREGEICELKNSVQQKVWRFKQKFLDTKLSSVLKLKKTDPSYAMLDEEKHSSNGDKKIEQMSSDIDNLKETLDLAFEKMQSAIVLSEIEPVENQWRWAIEKDTISIVTEGLLQNSRERVETENRKQENIALFLGEHWPCLMDDITSLRSALEPVSDRNDVQENLEEDKKDDESRYVAKMIKNHESIIRKKSEEMKWLWLKGEILQDKGSSSSSVKRDADYDFLKERVQNVMVRLDNMINWNTNLTENFDFSEKFLVDSDLTIDKKTVSVEMDNISVLQTKNEKQNDEIRNRNQDIEDSNLRSMIMEDTYFVLFRALMEELHAKLHDLNTDNFIREEIHRFVFNETVKNIFKDADIVSHDFSSGSELESMVKDDVYTNFFKETVKKWKIDVIDYDIENMIKDDIYTFVIFQLMKDACELLNDSEFQHQGEFPDELIEKLDFTLKCCEEKELDKWVVSEDFLTKEENNFDLIKSNLEMSLQQLNTCNTVLSELRSRIEEKSFCEEKDNEEERNQTTLTMLTSFMGFSQQFADFECTIHEKMDLNNSRLQELKHQQDKFSELVVSVKNRKKLYKKAFVLRCHNLQKAEIEVDLLGDQVDALIKLVEKIYATLHHYSPVLQQYFGVVDILRLIKKHLNA